MKIIDISPTLSEKIAVFPGDTPFSRQVGMHFDQGDHLYVSAITTTVHAGAHADAPHHYGRSGENIEQRELQFYLGPCQVVTVKCQPGARIKLSDFKLTAIIAPRILFRTDSFLNPNEWTPSFNSLSGEVVEALHKKGVRLVGIDTPSIDPAEDKILESHQAVLKNNMAILEGLVLTEVDDGFYTLVALPLKIQGADASPVRAVLLPSHFVDKT